MSAHIGCVACTGEVWAWWAIHFTPRHARWASRSRPVLERLPRRTRAEPHPLVSRHAAASSSQERTAVGRQAQWLVTGLASGPSVFSASLRSRRQHSRALTAQFQPCADPDGRLLVEHMRRARWASAPADARDRAPRLSGSRPGTRSGRLATHSGRHEQISASRALAPAHLAWCAEPITGY